MSAPPAFAQVSPTHSESPFPGLSALGSGAVYAKVFNSTYTGSGATNVQTIPFLPKMIVIFKGPGTDRLVVFVDVTVNPPLNVAVLTGAPTYVQFTGTTGITATSWDPQALDTLTSLNRFNTNAAPYEYWILG